MAISWGSVDRIILNLTIPLGRILDGLRRSFTGWLVKNPDQEHGLVILLQTILTYLLHDQLQDLWQRLCRVFRQQLLQTGQSKFLVPIIGHFRYAVGEHQEQVAF